MIKKDEIFIQILDPNGNPADAPAPPNAALTAIEKTIAVAVPSEKNKKSEP
jgi:cell division protein FtsB